MHAHKLPGFSAPRFQTQTQTGRWTKQLPQQERGHVGDPSGPTRETAPACGCLTLLAGPLPRPSVATTPPLVWIAAKPIRPGRKFSRKYGPGSFLFHLSTRRFPGSSRQTAGHSRVDNSPAVFAGLG